MNRLVNSLHQRYDGQKILILGWGREGQSTHTLLRQACPAAKITISDQQTSDLPTEVTVSPYLQQLETFDVIFKTPGIPVRTPELQAYLQTGKPLTSQLNEFLRVYRDQVIGVTGTKGKSTTSSLIAHLLQATTKTLLAGNIGLPVFDISEQITPDTQIVIEMSSYQLETVQFSPHIAVLLNFFPEHLNYHQSLENYLTAKSHITTQQTTQDVLIFNTDQPEFQTVAQQSRAQKIAFSYRHPQTYSPAIAHLLQRLDDVILPATIKGRNLLPALLAVEAATQADLSPENLIALLNSFQTLEHRLENLGTYGRITWIDDTLATIPEATVAALETLPRVDVLLLGGYDRGITYDRIVEACITHHVPAIGFFQPSGQKMYDLLTQRYPQSSWPVMKLVTDMEDAVRFCYQNAPAGGTVLLSPSSPSFGQFHDYRDKSAQFRDWILKLAKDQAPPNPL